MHGEVLQHLVRRGYETISDPDVMVEVSLIDMLPLFITGVLFALTLASVWRL
jgi:hypothetical protein